MLSYAIYAERWQWTPAQVDSLTIEQEDWLIPIAQAFDAERDYREKKSQEAADRKSRAKQNVTGF